MAIRAAGKGAPPAGWARRPTGRALGKGAVVRRQTGWLRKSLCGTLPDGYAVGCMTGPGGLATGG